jgi:hypothetical protein
MILEILFAAVELILPSGFSPMHVVDTFESPLKLYCILFFLDWSFSALISADKWLT